MAIEEIKHECRTCHGTKLTKCSKCQGTRDVPCSSCGGRGSQMVRGERQDCTGCRGTGKIKCYSCGGRGGHKCTSCHGIGFTVERRVQHDPEELRRTPSRSPSATQPTGHGGGLIALVSIGLLALVALAVAGCYLFLK